MILTIVIELITIMEASLVMSVFRIHLKPDCDDKYAELIEFCRSEGIIGIGWKDVTCTVDSIDVLKAECHRLTQPGAVYAGAKGLYKAMNAMRQIKIGDYIWTREGGNISHYYLCKVKSRWIDRIAADKYNDFDVANYVGCDWIDIGTEDNVPGHVVNSFIPSATAQHVYNVDKITSIIWHTKCNEDNQLDDWCVSKDELWNMLNPEDLECLVILYLQSKGYYLYSSSVKPSTKTFEGVLVYKDGSHKCYPQVKQNEKLEPSAYAGGISEKDRVVLFSSSENYGSPHSQVICLSRNELYGFMIEHKNVLPGNILYWLRIVSEHE